MPNASNVAKKSALSIKLPQQLLDRLDKCANEQRVTRSEYVRRLVERQVIDDQRMDNTRRVWHRLHVVRRCLMCRAFVRSGFVCQMCRQNRWDSIVVHGNVVPIPSLMPIPVTSRPDMRDLEWQTAEQIVLDAFAPVVAAVYEVLTNRDSLEPTNLDEVADLLALAATINK